MPILSTYHKIIHFAAILIQIFTQILGEVFGTTYSYKKLEKIKYRIRNARGTSVEFCDLPNIVFWNSKFKTKLVIFPTLSFITVTSMAKVNKKFWEELFASFPSIRNGQHRKRKNLGSHKESKVTS
jgi:hypothetical protein